MSVNIQEAAKVYTSNPEIAQKSDQAMQQLLTRSATDAEFRRKLLTNPREALAEFSGHEMPAGVNVVFIENKADATIVLPDPVDPSAELSESELETVAGGITPLCVWGCVAGALWLGAELVGAYKDATS
ncbi:MAG TPA: NHLP leader peptide family RiPP precursor [Gemmatimonadaceae bacterium]|nr:NHLP leader peptide family RiPP precursor [Gemmatimonadaceae bacterium]